MCLSLGRGSIFLEYAVLLKVMLYIITDMVEPRYRDRSGQHRKTQFSFGLSDKTSKLLKILFFSGYIVQSNV